MRRICALVVFSIVMAGGSAAETNTGITLFDGAQLVRIEHDDTGAAPLAKAAKILTHDLAALTGRMPAVGAGRGPAIIFGRADAPRIAQLLVENHIDASGLNGKWESYGRAVIPAPDDPAAKALLIFGSDTRGTIWGVMDLSREMGVSPWEWWGDAKIHRVNRIAVKGGLFLSKEPSVKYRGVFLNDEEFGLWPWAANTYDPKLHDIGPKTYARIYELLWRLKANTFWPAMRGIEKSFNQIEGNAKEANDWAILRASSHAEPMGRTNLREWDEEKEGPFNYFNQKQKILDYWNDSVTKAAPYENIFTVGLRGIEDRPMQGANGPAEMAHTLEDVFAQQRLILSRDLNKPADQIPQIFTPYKEVLPAYEAGLKIPDDVTINWPDDNYGYIRKLSNAKERRRGGGSGVYYHAAYWGYPQTNLWLGYTNPALIWEEMTKAYHFNARRIWILNVGDIKPLEYLSQLFMDLGFDTDAFADVGAVKAHLRRWAAVNFDEVHAGVIEDVMWRYYQLAFERSPEAMGFNLRRPTTTIRPTLYDMYDFGDENAGRLAAYRQLAADAARIQGELPADRRDAFFEMVRYGVDSSAAINERQLSLDKTVAYAGQHRASANQYADRAAAADKRMREDTHLYNDVVAGGKWKNMMSLGPHNIPVLKRPFVPHWKVDPSDSQCAIQIENGGFYDTLGDTPGNPHFMDRLLRLYPSDLPPFHRELGGSRYADIFVKAPVKTAWTVKANKPWIRLDRTAGTFDPKGELEARVQISIDWAGAPARGQGTVEFRCANTVLPLPVPVSIAPNNTVKNVSFIEENGIVSMYAGHADSVSGGFERIDGLGHTATSLRARLDMPSLDVRDIARGPSATFRFATTNAVDRADLKVIALPFLPISSDNGMRAAVSVDGGPPVVLDFNAPEFSARWSDQVATNSHTETLHDLALKPGAHTVTVTALDPGFTLDRLELAFDGAAQAYGPVPETRI
jgi:hypothetical protein